MRSHGLPTDERLAWADYPFGCLSLLPDPAGPVSSSQYSGGPSSSWYIHCFSHQQSAQSLHIQWSSFPYSWLTSSCNETQKGHTNLIITFRYGRSHNTWLNWWPEFTVQAELWLFVKEAEKDSCYEWKTSQCSFRASHRQSHLLWVLNSTRPLEAYSIKLLQACIYKSENTGLF